MLTISIPLLLIPIIVLIITFIIGIILLRSGDDDNAIIGIFINIVIIVFTLGWFLRGCIE